MKIVGLMVCGPNEKYLERSLQELARLCDDAIICLNNATKREMGLVKKYKFWTYIDNREWGKYQPDIKTDLLIRIGRLKPDWVIAIDADEVFAPEFTRSEAERLASSTEIAYYFMVVNLYNDIEHFAHNVGIQRFWNIRFFKYLSDNVQYQRKSLHCGLAPPIFYKYGWHAPYYLEHYGLMLKEDRDRKVKRYEQYDPNAKYKSRDYYDDLKKDLPMLVFNRSKLLKQLAETSETQPRKTPKL